MTDPPAPSTHGAGAQRVRLLALVVVLVIAVTAVTIGTRSSRNDLPGAEVGAALADVTTTQATGLSIPVGPTLPIPEALPVNAYAPTPQVVLGTIEIPRIGLTADLQRGVTLTAINRGPGWWPGTAMPGELGNAVVAGHRTTYSKPFARLDELQPGDQVVFTTDAGRFVYAVRGIVIVPGDWIDIAAQPQAHTATLFACHPPGSARERIVAKLQLLNPDGTPVDDELGLPPLDAEAQSPDHTLVVRDNGEDPTPGTGTDPFGDTAG